MHAFRFSPHRLLRSAPLAIILMMTIVTGVLPALPVDNASAQGTGQYYGQKYICPPGFDPGSAGAQAAFDNCTLPVEGQLSFTIRSNDQSYQGSTQQTSGSFGWTDVPLGSDYFVAEALPQGYLEPWVYCEVSQFAAGGGDFQTYYFKAPGGEMFIAGNINGYELTNCTWFNVPPGNGNAQLTQGATVTIQKYFCESGYDSQPRTIEDYSQDCTTPHEGAQFSLQQDLGNPQQTGQNGQAGFANVPYGNIDIRELKTEQWRLVATYCRVIPSADPDGSYQQSDQQNIDEEPQAWKVSLNATDGNRVVCVFYNIPEEEGATVFINKYLCSPGFDYENTVLSGFGSNCNSPHEGVHFEIPFNSGGHEGTTDDNGQLQLPGIPYGNIELHESQMPGYLSFRAYCFSAAVANGGLSDDKEVPILDDTASSGDYIIQFNIPEGEDLFCYIFNVPVDGEGGPGTVAVTKYICPPEYEPTSGELPQLLEGCTETHVGAGVNLFNGVGQYGGATDSSGNMQWDDFASGPVTIGEQTAGYALIRAYCHGVPANQQNDALTEYVESAVYQEGSYYKADTHLEPGYHLHCYLFNASLDTGYGTVYAYKYNCPADFDYENGGRDYLFANCTETPDIHFSLDVQTPAFHEEWLVNPDGWAIFDQVPAGPFTLSEEDQDGYQLVAVYCGVTAQNNASLPGTWEDTGFSGGINYEAVAGQYVHCEFYNAPAQPTNTLVEVVKYRCLEGYDYATALYEDLLTNCSDTIESVDFTITNTDGYSETRKTDGGGEAAWSNVPPSLVQIREEPIPQYEPVRVFCANTPNENSTPALFQGYDLDAVGHYIEIGVTENYTLTCHWFNAPKDQGQVLLTKFVCDPFFTRGDADYLDFVDNCTTYGEGFHFSLLNTNSEVVDEGTTGANGTVPLVGSPGTHYLVETESEGYISLAVYCTTDSGTPPTTPLDSPPAVDLTSGANVYCSWFNGEYKPPAYEPGDIVIHKYDCPPGYPTEPSGGRSPFEWLFNGCQQPDSGVSFNAEQSGTQVGSGSTDASGATVISGVAAGTTRISELPREGWGPPIILCASYPVTSGRVLVTFDQQTVDNWGHSYDRQQDYVLECYWFNFPPSQGTDGAPIQIIIHKYLCEEGYAYSGQSYADISTACSSAENLVNFDLSGGDGSTSGGPTDLNGYAEYNGVAPGSVSITETPREGYRTLAIYCTNYVNTPGEPSYFPSEEGQLLYYVAPGYKLECYWFNAPEENYGHVEILKVSCHEDYEYPLATREELAENCIEPQGGVMFNLGGPNGYSTAMPTDSSGGATWSDLSVGQYTLTETPPSGYYPVRIYCTVYPYEGIHPTEPSYSGTWDEYTAGLTVSIPVTPGHIMYCVVYNAPVDDYGYIVVYKYSCDDEPAYTHRDEYYASCANPIGSVRFDVAGDGGYTAFGETDAGGLKAWMDVPAGPVNIWETPPEGYVPWAVFCGYANPGNEVPTTWDERPLASDYGIASTVQYQKVLYCEWYNVPYEDDPPQVWIQKYNCPDEADWHWNYHQLLAECHEPGANVEYGIGPDESSLSLAMTDSSGRIVLGDLDPGDLTILENYPSGYSGFVVYCQFATPQHTGSYQKADVYNRTIKLELDYGYVVTCVFFNFPDGYQPPDVSPPTTGHPPLTPPVGGSSGGGSSGGGTGGTGGTSGAGGSGNGTGGALGLPPVDPATPANLIITKFTCEAGYDVLAEDADAGLDCTDLTDDISYALASIDDPAFAGQDGLTGDDGEGKVAFSGLPAGSYLLSEELPEGTIAAFIYTCTSDRRDFQQENPFIPFAFAGPDGRIGVTLEPGETLECDWFDVPEEAPGGEVTVLKFGCPGATVIVAQCAPWPDGATVTFSPVEGSDEPATVTTGPDGSAVANMEGIYSVTEIPDTACLIDSDGFDESGNLVVNEGDQIEVRVYNCNVQT